MAPRETAQRSVFPSHLKTPGHLTGKQTESKQSATIRCDWWIVETESSQAAGGETPGLYKAF